MLSNVHPQVYFRINRRDSIYKQMQEKNIKFFFDAFSAVDSFRCLEEQCKLGTTDIYIVDDLCYRLKDVRKFADEHNVQVRLILNSIPSKVFDKGRDIKSPWFLPETVDELEKYIDIVDIDSDSWIKIDTLYKIWFKDQKWRANLGFIYPELEINIPNQSLIPNFAIYKMNCGYRCAYGSSCKKCLLFKELADDLANKNIEYNFQRKEDQNEK